MPLEPPVSFGEVWLVKTGSAEPEPYLVVSADIYLGSGLPRVIGCQVVRREPRRGEIAEPLPGYGAALLDRIEWLWREWLTHRPPLQPVLPEHRHHAVHRLICNLFGP